MSNHALPSVGQAPTFQPTKESLGTGYVGKGAHCSEGGTGTECFLDPGTRQRLIEDYKLRVISAEGKWAQAMTRAQVANLVKKDPDLPIIVSFVLEALVDQLFVGAKLGMKLLRSKAPSYIRNFKLLPDASPTAAADALTKVDENGLVSQAVKAGKKATTGAIEEGLTDASEERKAKQSYLALLEREAEGAWQSQREDPPGWADDAALIALYHSFDVGAGHTTENYAKALTDIVAKYESSPASRIGTTEYNVRADEPARQDGAPGFPTFRDRSIRVVQEIEDGESVRFMYYKADKHRLTNLGPEGRKVERKKWNYDEEQWEADKPALSEFTPWKPVEPDMLTAAIHNNQREWGVAFDAKEVHSSLASYMKPAKKPAMKSDSNNGQAKPSAHEPTNSTADNTAPDLAQAAVSSVMPGTKVPEPTKSVVTATNPLAPPSTFLDLY